jgi:hypothetical protein
MSCVNGLTFWTAMTTLERRDGDDSLRSKMSKSKAFYFIIFTLLFLNGLVLFNPYVQIQSSEDWWYAVWIDALLLIIGAKLIKGPPTASA